MRRGQRRSAHPVIGDLLAGAAVGDDLALTLAAGATSAPPCRPPSSRSTPPVPLTGHHILVLDDTWTTGSRAQSAALTLRAAGAAHISVIVVDVALPRIRPQRRIHQDPPAARLRLRHLPGHRWHLPVTARIQPECVVDGACARALAPRLSSLLAASLRLDAYAGLT